MNESKGKRSVLLVEDDPSFRRIISKNLSRNELNVREAENGLVAKTIFDLNPEQFDLIISDIRMPELDGVALLKHVRTTSKTPFIVMTGFSEILESQSAHQLGATAFLPKPLQSKALLEEIHKCLYPQDKLAPPKIKEFRQISIDEFVSATNLHSDIFLSLGPDHYVKIAHKGEAISLERLKVYKANKVSHLYVTEDDFKAYANFNIKLAKVAVSNSTISTDTKVLVLKHAAEVLTQICFTDAVDKKMIASANTMVTEAIQLVNKNGEALDLLTNLSTHSNPLYGHSVAVSMFASLIAQKYDWKASPTLNKVALAGLFHDAGKRELISSLLTRKRSSLSPDEIMQLETHPSRGRDMLLQLNGMPEEIAQVAYEHHEKMNGTGFPRRLKGEAIHPLARLIHLADRFVNYIMPMTVETPKLDPKEAIRKIANIHGEEVDGGFLMALAQMYKMDDIVVTLIKEKVSRHG